MTAFDEESEGHGVAGPRAVDQDPVIPGRRARVRHSDNGEQTQEQTDWMHDLEIELGGQIPGARIAQEGGLGDGRGHGGDRGAGGNDAPAGAADERFGFVEEIAHVQLKGDTGFAEPTKLGAIAECETEVGRALAEERLGIEQLSWTDSEVSGAGAAPMAWT
jgi:hypothetical protein